VHEDYGWVFNETPTFSPRLVYVARFGRTEDDYTNLLALADQDINTQIGLKGMPIQGNGLTGGLTGVTFSNSLSGLAGASPSRAYSAVNQFSDMATWNQFLPRCSARWIRASSSCTATLL
jgi:hypothetical protein